MTCALKKSHEKKLEVAEMRILREMCEVIKLDIIRNEIIKEEQQWRKSQRKYRKGDWSGMGM